MSERGNRLLAELAKLIEETESTEHLGSKWMAWQTPFAMAYSADDGLQSHAKMIERLGTHQTVSFEFRPMN